MAGSERRAQSEELRLAEQAAQEAHAAYWQAREALEDAELSLRFGMITAEEIRPIQERVEATYARWEAANQRHDELAATSPPAPLRAQRGAGGEVIPRDRIGYVIGPHVAPVLTIESGQRVIVETEDALSGRIRTNEDQRPEALARFHAERDAGLVGPNPVTGPIFVRGAEPGDTLVVRVERIELDDQGVTRFRKELSPLGDLFTADRIQICRIANGMVHFNERVRFPSRPMVGVIGTAPALESPSSGRSGSYGGNMDCPEIAPGATVYLPVAVPGALLFVGDCHAAMADAEICNTAVETRATVTLTVEVRKGRPAGFHWPRVETPEEIMVVAGGTPLDQTLQHAYRDLILWMEAEYGWDRGEAYLIATQVADGRLCNSWTIRAVMPKRYL